MELLIILVSIEVVASKFLEAYIAYHRRDTRNNSLTGRLFSRVGVENDPWLPFFSTVFVVMLVLYFLNSFHVSATLQFLYIFTGLFTTTLNLAAAHSNYFGRKNFITERIRR